MQCVRPEGHTPEDALHITKDGRGFHNLKVKMNDFHKVTAIHLHNDDDIVTAELEIDGVWVPVVIERCNEEGVVSHIIELSGIEKTKTSGPMTSTLLDSEMKKIAIRRKKAEALMASEMKRNARVRVGNLASASLKKKEKKT